MLRVVLLWCSCTLLIGCLRSNLIECGEIVCSANQRCLPGPRCATEAQISACDGAMDGTPCTDGAGDGVCDGGVCVIGRCGNDVLEPGEVCDDGNRISGDGCREDCLSNETCGNGIMDLGESCDCGASDGLRPLYCRTTNATAPEADCDPSCTRRCGDGIVTGTEACDGTESAFTCQDLGFYEGEMGCTPVCRLDLTSCTGRCGDGVVQPFAGEQCDGAPPSGETCVSFGYDAGRLGCNGLCAADLANDCERAGWIELLPMDSTKRYLDADANARGVIAIEDPDKVVGLWDGAPISHTGSFRFSVATSSVLIAVGNSSIATFDGVNWSDGAGPPGVPRRVMPSPSGTIFSMRADCTIDLWSAGSWSTLPSKASSSCFAFHVEADDELYVSSGATLYRYDGTSWAEVALQDNDFGIYSITKRAQGLVIAREDGVKQVGGSPFSIAPSNVFVAAGTGGVVLAIYDDHALMVANDESQQLPYVRGSAYHGLVYDARRSPDGRLIAFAKGVYQLGSTWFSNDAAPTNVDEPPRLLVRSDGRVFSCGSTVRDVLHATDLGWDAPGASCRRLVATSTGLFALTGDMFHSYVPGGGWPGEFSPGDGNEQCDDAECLVDVWVDPSLDKPFVLSTVAVYRRDAEGDFVEIGAPVGCTWNAISGYPGHLYIAGSCAAGPAVYHYDGTWHSLPAPPRSITSLYAAPNGELFGAYVVSSVVTRAIRFSQGAWSVLGDGYGLLVSGTSATDVFFAQGDLDHGAEVIYRWDGVGMSSVRLSGGATGVDAIAGAGDVLAVYRSSGRVDTQFRTHR